MATTSQADPVTLGILRALAAGKTDHEAAHLVHVSPRTVQRVVDSFKQASGAPTRFAAGVAACRLGLLDDPPIARPTTDTTGLGRSA
ncbi:helix-turn-helix domain-containing protein [Jatrophihabitans sp. YIM 134969]